MRIFRRVFSLLLLVLGGFIGWHIRSFFGSPSIPPEPSPLVSRGTGLVLLEGVPDVRQSTSYSCGTAALQAVLHYYGIEEREDRLDRRELARPAHARRPGRGVP